MMARKSAAPPPLTLEAREEVLRVIAATAEPLAAGAIAKLLSDSCRIAPKQLVSILDEYVAAGTLRSFPAGSATGKLKYWDRDPEAAARAAVLEAVQRAARPLTAAEVAKFLKSTWKLPASAVSRVLEELAAERSLHSIPGTTTRGKARYWHRDAIEVGRIIVLETLEKGPQTESALKKVLKGFSDAQVRQVLESMTTGGGLWRHPPIGKSKQQLLASRPPFPGPYLKDVGEQLTKVVEQLLAAGVPREDLRRALVQIVEKAGIPFSAGSIGNSSRAEPAAAVDLIALMKRLEPGAERGALVGARDLRRAAQLEKGPFDRAVLELSRQGVLALHRHDYVASLTPAERDELVTDGNGTYYIGVALRQN